ncbi:NAD-dependent deacetylase sirtuin-2 [Zopfochytrium polystomum]|nr:NAD-dependent deacetylase sirtuin-2 [Zopfochytrium polystomum]
MSRILAEAVAAGLIPASSIVVMTGAGISTAAGIPDFRSPGTGLYDNLQRFGLPYPEAVFDIDYFRRKPQPFYELAKELYPGGFSPTYCHHFIKVLADEGLLLRCYTQNIDTLERVAGLTDEHLIEAHGSFHSATGALPLCASCGTGLVKPDITFFGESLPARFHANAAADLARADALVVVGTSLTVYPFAGLIAQCRDDVPRLLINRERVGEAGRSGGFRVVGAGFDFDGTGGGVGAAPAFGRRPPPPPRRDALFLGDCDDGCRRLAELLGVAGKVDDAMRAFEEAHRHAAAAQTESPPRAAGVATLDHMMKDMTFGA